MSTLSLQIYFVSNSSGCIYHSNYYWKHWIDYWLLRNLLSHQPWHVHFFIMRDVHKCVLLLIWKVYSHMKWNAASFLAKSSNFFVISAYSSISHIHSEYPLPDVSDEQHDCVFFFLVGLIILTEQRAHGRNILIWKKNLNDYLQVLCGHIHQYLTCVVHLWRLRIKFSWP